MFLKFDVFGKMMSVQRKDEQRLLYLESNTGLIARVFNVIVPSKLSALLISKRLNSQVIWQIFIM